MLALQRASGKQFLQSPVEDLLRWAQHSFGPIYDDYPACRRSPPILLDDVQLRVIREARPFRLAKDSKPAAAASNGGLKGNGEGDA